MSLGSRGRAITRGGGSKRLGRKVVVPFRLVHWRSRPERWCGRRSWSRWLRGRSDLLRRWSGRRSLSGCRRWRRGGGESEGLGARDRGREVRLIRVHPEHACFPAALHGCWSWRMRGSKGGRGRRRRGWRAHSIGRLVRRRLLPVLAVGLPVLLVPVVFTLLCRSVIAVSLAEAGSGSTAAWTRKDATHAVLVPGRALVRCAPVRTLVDDGCLGEGALEAAETREMGLGAMGGDAMALPARMNGGLERAMDRG